MSKKFNIFLTILFCAFIGGMGVISLLLPDKDFSELENRYLQKPPKLSLETLSSGKFMEDAEDYVSDHILGRDFWVAAKAWSERLSGKKENEGVYFGAKDTLINRVDTPAWEDTPAQQGVPAKQGLLTRLGFVDALVGNVDVPVYFGLIPSAAEVWKERLPEGAPTADEKAIIDQLYFSTGAATIDLYDTLNAHRDEDVYYRTDHHWTSLGAYYGYTGLATALGYTPVPLNDYTETVRSTEFYGTVFSSSGVRWVRPDTISTYVPDDGITVASHTYDNKGNPVEEPRQLYDTSFLSVKDKYSMFLGGNQPLGVVKNANNPDGPRLLIIRDSYADSLVPFLTPHFSEIHLVDLRYYKLSIADYIAQNGIDQALVLYSVPNFVTDSNLLWIAK